MGTPTIRILVAEDQQLVRDGIVTMLGVRADFAVVAQAGDGAYAVAEAHRTHPDVALIDIRMPVLDGIEATRQITSELPGTGVLVLTTFGSDEFVFSALAAGRAVSCSRTSGPRRCSKRWRLWPIAREGWTRRSPPLSLTTSAGTRAARTRHLRSTI